MATLNDVAKLAGVTPMTVSRVVNNPSVVKPETREKVERAMKELNYTPNVAARNLATNRTHIIDVYIPESIDLANPFSMYSIIGISKALSKHYYSFLILRNLDKEHECDGYIFTGLLRNEIEKFQEYAQERNRPFVLFGHTKLDNIDFMDVDNVKGGQIATDHLIDNGHRRIAMINVQEDKDYPDDRLKGYKKALKDHGIDYDEELVVWAENSVAGGTSAMRRLLNKGLFSAVFCATDTLAIGANIAIAENGLKVPDDISIVGFDALGHDRLNSPQITSVHQPIAELGEMLAEELIAKIDGRETKHKNYIEPYLSIGGSVSNIK